MICGDDISVHQFQLSENPHFLFRLMHYIYGKLETELHERPRAKFSLFMQTFHTY